MNASPFPIFRYFVLCMLFPLACKDKNCPDHLEYQIPYTALPVQDTFQIGDTIRMELDFADVLTDVQGGVTNTFTNYDFRFELECSQFDIDPPQATAVHFMDVIPSVGEVVPRGLPSSGISYYEMHPVYADNRYRFKSVVVLKQTGTFLCGILPYSDDRIDPFEITGNCDHLRLKIGSKVNGGDPIENNYHLVKSSPASVYHDMTMERFGQWGFCFVVKP